MPAGEEVTAGAGDRVQLVVLTGVGQLRVVGSEELVAAVFGEVRAQALGGRADAVPGRVRVRAAAPCGGAAEECTSGKVRGHVVLHEIGRTAILTTLSKFGGLRRDRVPRKAFGAVLRCLGALSRPAEGHGEHVPPGAG